MKNLLRLYGTPTNQLFLKKNMIPMCTTHWLALMVPPLQCYGQQTLSDMVLSSNFIILVISAKSPQWGLKMELVQARRIADRENRKRTEREQDTHIFSGCPFWIMVRRRLVDSQESYWSRHKCPQWELPVVELVLDDTFAVHLWHSRPVRPGPVRRRLSADWNHVAVLGSGWNRELIFRQLLNA